MAYLFKIILITFTIFSIIVKESESRPGDYPSYSDVGTMSFDDGLDCEHMDGNEVEVCQRCAKQTKSPIVYPMCCRNEEDVYNWCNAYIHYGKQP